MKRLFYRTVLVIVVVLMGVVSYAQEGRKADSKDQPKAEAQCSDQKLIEDVEDCLLSVQSNFSFEAYVSADCKVHVKGDPKRKNRSYATFDSCLSSKGQPIKSWERE
jgi:hypothetical protein